ncbi:MAG: carbamoyltransferase HypF [Deltaproteobacteria bacterium HGW-Deltaproteobacteria-13]|jgi:hydrogenase maturation protein HypF|nr:MAG: carbamoyltransferase HypF [Deltaproteobacteria bacterium HGW-Deltaproteobacteria-13]
MHSKNKDVNKKRVRYLFSGIVQGVGFRPFVYRQAVKNNLTGFVQNRPDGVVAEVEGYPEALDIFLMSIREDLPPLAHITSKSSWEIKILNDNTFQIIGSDAQGHADVHITPDAAICDDCLKELFDPTDRRFRYPFINCTNCGPRLTIINAIPYDRVNTSMSCFPQCPQCLAEYENPADRRFHAEPNACPVCGPQMMLLDAEGEIIKTDDPVRAAIDLLKSGQILAIKGLGGFHLSVDAGNDEAVKKLRSRKYREEKPLAIMARDIVQARRIAGINEEEKMLLTSVQRPIVLLKKINNDLISDFVAPAVPDLGVMLPYAPLHYLLLENNFTALVMTSANQVDEPICTGNREAVTRLLGIADYFLVHNRDILVRCDDSIAFVSAKLPQLMRRSRGYVPQPLALKDSMPAVLALGPQLKTTQCILKDNFAYLSPHIGDLETPQARDFFSGSLTLMKRITESDPQIVACDYHPGYYSTQAAREIPADKVIRVQHHHAHIVSCMADNQIEGDVIGLAMDGTGYGLDGNAWGGEFLIASETGFQRFGHLQYLVLPGGEKSIREPWRIAASLLKAAWGPSWKEIALHLKLMTDQSICETLDKIIESRMNSPLSSGLGRLFDGVAALIGLRRTVSFEGQAAMELEAQAADSSGSPYPFAILQDGDKSNIIDYTDMIKAIVADLDAGKSKAHIAASFHQTLTDAFTVTADKMRKATGLTRVVLSGGCFQNKILLEGSIEKLRNDGFEVYCHRQIPANDGGVSLGQAVIASSMIKKGLA